MLKPSGSIFVNLGDKYAGSRPDGSSGWHTYPLDRPKDGYSRPTHERLAASQGGLRTHTDTPAKSLMGLPWRYAIACTDQLGLILRRDIIWAKPNGLPESVTDRCRSSHEYLFHFTVRPRYYAAVDEIREPHYRGPNTHAQGPGGSYTAARVPGGRRMESGKGITHRTFDKEDTHLNPLGKLPGSVWEVPSQPLTVPDALGVDHFAAFPMELPRRCVLGWSPPGICTACGEGRRPVSGYDRQPAYRNVEDKRISEAVTVRWCSAFTDWCEARGVTRRDLDAAAGTSDMGGWWASRLPHRCAVPTPEQYALLAARWPDMPAHPGDDLWEPFTRRVAWSFQLDNAEVTGRHTPAPKPVIGLRKTITGYVCACPQPDAPTRPAVVLDPFGGTGTTALVASMHGRTGISVDMSGDYCRLAAWRTADPAERAKALQVPKPPPVSEGQSSLFDMGAS